MPRPLLRLRCRRQLPGPGHTRLTAGCRVHAALASKTRRSPQGKGRTRHGTLSSAEAPRTEEHPPVPPGR